MEKKYYRIVFDSGKSFFVRGIFTVLAYNMRRFEIEDGYMDLTRVVAIWPLSEEM